MQLICSNPTTPVCLEKAIVLYVEDDNTLPGVKTVGAAIALSEGIMQNWTFHTKAKVSPGDVVLVVGETLQDPSTDAKPKHLLNAKVTILEKQPE